MWRSVGSLCFIVLTSQVGSNILLQFNRDLPSGILGDVSWESGAGASDLDAPKPCCWPDQWQGNVTFQVGAAERRGSKFQEGAFSMYVDKTNKRVAGKGVCGMSKDGPGGFVILFKSNNTADGYFFRPSSQKCCKKNMKNAIFRPQCIPANATYGGDFTLGPSSGGLAVQAWSDREHQSKGGRGEMDVSWTAVIKPQGCIPIFIRDHGMVRLRPHEEEFPENEITFTEVETEDEDKPHPKPCPGCGKIVKFIESLYFSNMETSIKDPSVFTPPSYCPKSDAREGECDLMDDFSVVMQRFVAA